MLNKILILFVFTFAHLNAQNKNGIVIYKIAQSQALYNDGALTSTNVAVQNMVAGVKYIPKLRPILKFNSNFSVFIPDNDGSRVMSSANISAGCFVEKYVDLKNNKLIQLSGLGGPTSDTDEFRIEETIKNNWVITKETKNIDKYKCFKATKIQKIDGETENLTAWFCPELPFPFGPLGQFGLPGLILELQTNKLNFGVDKIELTNKEIDIKLPTKGKLIDKTVHEKEVKKRFDDFSK